MVDIFKYKIKNESKEVFCEVQLINMLFEMQLGPPDSPLFPLILSLQTFNH